ncbi:hypothetical protein [Bacillus chungangensis]|uniref:Uncharacterized protein n=1 Tax=Bacillus chungangensis TaxID=587633 RepID=A0ABT9WNJ6_9BACI|nr:hypothetical protein [Bacillus chungangensis]MDQ0174785.1 hypothetical protein [Bacillus chungangensis]
MSSIISLFFLLGGLFLIVTLHFLLSFYHGGIYPPKRILKKRVHVFATITMSFFLFGLLLWFLF